MTFLFKICVPWYYIVCSTVNIKLMLNLFLREWCQKNVRPLAFSWINSPVFVLTAIPYRVWPHRVCVVTDSNSAISIVLRSLTPQCHDGTNSDSAVSMILRSLTPQRLWCQILTLQSQLFYGVWLHSVNDITNSDSAIWIVLRSLPPQCLWCDRLRLCRSMILLSPTTQCRWCHRVRLPQWIHRVRLQSVDNVKDSDSRRLNYSMEPVTTVPMTRRSFDSALSLLPWYSLLCLDSTVPTTP
jgi:hypothetical protein